MQCAGFDHDHYQEAACAYHKEHMMHDCVQLDHVVDSHDEYTYDSNIIMCDQHVRDNEVPILHSYASSVPTDAFMMIYDDMCEPHDQSVSYPSWNTVVKNSLIAELAIYKVHVELKKRATLIMIPSVRFTKLIIHHLQRKHRFHPRPDSPLHLSNEEPVLGYLKLSAKGTKREIFGMPIPGFLAGETRSTQDLPAPRPAKPARKPQSTAQKAPTMPSISSLVTSTQPVPTSVPAKTQEHKHKQATGTTDKPAKAKRIKRSVSRNTCQSRGSPKSVGASEAKEVLAEEPQVAEEDADFQKAMEESMKDAYALPKGPLPPVVIREPESGKYQPLPEVPGKGKAKVSEEQVAHDLLSLQKYKKTSPTDQYIFQSAQAEGQAGSNLDETSEGQAGSNPDETSKGQAGPDPSNAEARVQSTLSPVVHAGLDRQHMDIDVTNVSLQPSTEQLYERFTATIYSNVQKNLKFVVEEPVLLEEPASLSGTLSSLQHLSRDFTFGDQFLCDKPSDADKSAETEVESIVNVPIQQVMSSISLMPSPIIDLTSRPESPTKHPQLKATTINTTTTTTTTLPPLQAPQQSTTEAMMVKRIGELEHTLADLIQVNKTIEERLDKHGGRLYTLEQLDIPHQVSIAVSEVVTDVVDWAMQAPLRNRFKDLPEADMKEILYQRMWETDSYKSHEVHMQLFKALEKSINRDQSEELAHDLAEARKKKKKSRESPKMPPGSPSHQPPPPPPPAGPSGTSRAPRASESQVTPPPPPPPTSTNQDSPSTGSAAPSPAKTVATTEHQAWLTLDVTLKPLVSLTPEDLDLDEAMGLDEQAQLSDEEDIGSVHIPTVNLRQGWWKPFEEERPTTSEPAWSIRSSDVPVPPKECKYDIAAMYGISHSWFQRQRFYIDRHTSKGDRSTVRTHMQILSVVRIKVFSMYGYDYMKKIFLRYADLNEHVIAERDFKYLYPSDFEDLNMLNLQGHLNHLPPKDKKILTMAVNQWTRQLVIRQRVEDFQLGIESYQTQVNLTKPQWTATGFEYKHDYIVIESPKAVIFRDKYGVQMMMRFNEIHKFSDETLQQIVEALDY
nr:hypothetical protein [Tanacetum cinerariifolium]